MRSTFWSSLDSTLYLGHRKKWHISCIKKVIIYLVSTIFELLPIFCALYIHVHLAAAGSIKAIMLMAVILRLEIVKYPRSRQPSTPFSCNRNCWPKGNCGTRYYSYLLFSYSLDLSSILEHLSLPPIVVGFKVPFNPNGTSCKLSNRSANIIYFQSVFKDDQRAHVYKKKATCVLLQQPESWSPHTQLDQGGLENVI